MISAIYSYDLGDLFIRSRHLLRGGEDDDLEMLRHVLHELVHVRPLAHVHLVRVNLDNEGTLR